MHRNLRNYTRTILTLLIAVVWLTGFAQQGLTSAEVQAQLRSKGVTEVDLQKFLDSKSLTVAQLEQLSPEELLQLSDELDTFMKVDRSPAKKTVKTVKTPKKKPTSRADVEKKTTSQITKSSTATENDKNPTRFGDQLFINPTISLIEGAANRPVPGRYTLNPGDQVSVSIYGRSKLDQVYTIDESGSIAYDNGNRRLLVGGLSLNQARKKIEQAFGSVYVFRTGEITINVVGVSTIAVSIYGEVQKPGGYLISAVNSPINALFAARGINSKGSYRNIKLIKENGYNVDIDLYTFLTEPEKMPEIGLSNNDVIHVPSLQNVVSLQGAVNRPMQYELKASETVADLLRFANGLSQNANTDYLQVTRLENGIKRVYDVDLNGDAASSFVLQNGDLVSISSITSEVSNAIEVIGQVNNPGSFELQNGMLVSDLIGKLVFNESTRKDLALINRTQKDGRTELIKVNLSAIQEDDSNPSNIELQNNDVLLIWAIDRFVDNSSNLILAGAVKFPGKYPYDRNSKTQLSEVIEFAGGLRRDASNVGMIYRREPLNKKIIEYIRINPISAVESVDDNSLNIQLMPYDSIVVIEDKQIVSAFTVEISGQVNNGGVYQYGDGMTVKDLLVLAKGFTLSAQTEQIEVNRVIIQNNQPTEVKIATIKAERDLAVEDETSTYVLKPFDKVYVRTVPEFELQQVVTISGEVKYPGQYVLEKKNEKLMDVIKRAGGFTSQAFLTGSSLNRTQNDVGEIILNMAEAQKSNRSKYNYVLKNRDVITIPKQQDIVTLQSNSLYKRVPTLQKDNLTDNTVSFAYFPGKKAGYYVRKFGGGFGETSDRKELFVQHANGEIAETKDFMLFRLYPKVREGSLIVLPEKEEEKLAAEEKEPIDWNQVLSNSVAQATSLLTLILFIDRI